jgi:hypothetical protein
MGSVMRIPDAPRHEVGDDIILRILDTPVKFNISVEEYKDR